RPSQAPHHLSNHLRVDFRKNGRMNHIFWASCAAVGIGFGGLLATTYAVEPLQLEVAAGAHDREQTPISLKLPESWKNVSHARLTTSGGQQVPVQLDRSASPHAVWLLESKLPAGAKRHYRLEALDASSDTPDESVTVEDTGEQVIVRVGPRKVMQYN